MVLDPYALYSALLEWPKRPAGSEDEMMAREMLMVHLERTSDVHISEEAVYVPRFRNFISFFICLMLLIAVWASAIMPEISLIAASLLFAGYLGHRLGFDMPFTSLLTKAYSANMVASKGQGSRLFIIMSHLDTNRVTQTPAFLSGIGLRAWHYVQVGFLFVSVFWLLLLTLGHKPSMLEYMCVSLCVIVSYITLHFGYARFTGAECDLLSVVSAAAIADRLWAKPIPDMEVRLVVLTGRSDGMLGAIQYMKHHEVELKKQGRYRDVYILGIEDIGGGNLAYIKQAGFWDQDEYQNTLVTSAARLSAQQSAFSDVEALRHTTGYLHTQPFNRADITSISIVGSGEGGECPAVKSNIASPEVQAGRIERAVRFGEAITRATL